MPFGPWPGASTSVNGVTGAVEIALQYRDFFSQDWQLPDAAFPDPVPGTLATVGGLRVVQLANGVTQGVSWTDTVPKGDIQQSGVDPGWARIYLTSAANVLPGAVKAVGLRLSWRTLYNNQPISGWATITLTDIAIPNSVDWQYDRQDFILGFGVGEIGTEKGAVIQFELSRIPPAAGVDLPGDLNLVRVGFRWTRLQQ